MHRRRLTGKTSTSCLLDEVEVGRGCFVVGGLLVVRHDCWWLLFVSMYAVGESVFTKGVRSLLLGLLLLLMLMLMVKRTRNKKQAQAGTLQFKSFQVTILNQPPRGVAPGRIISPNNTILAESNVCTINSLMSNTHQQERQWC